MPATVVALYNSGRELTLELPPHLGRGRTLMRRILVLLTTMVSGVLLASGVALAADVQCLGGPLGLCVGTEERDRITGSEQNDQIVALGGADVVAALGGDDDVEGGAGADDISGGVGADILAGGGGPDDIEGGPGTSAASEPLFTTGCDLGDASILAHQLLLGGNGNDI